MYTQCDYTFRFSGTLRAYVAFTALFILADFILLGATVAKFRRREKGSGVLWYWLFLTIILFVLAGMTALTNTLLVSCFIGGWHNGGFIIAARVLLFFGQFCILCIILFPVCLRIREKIGASTKKVTYLHTALMLLAILPGVVSQIIMGMREFVPLPMRKNRMIESAQTAYLAMWGISFSAFLLGILSTSVSTSKGFRSSSALRQGRFKLYVSALLLSTLLGTVLVMFYYYYSTFVGAGKAMALAYTFLSHFFWSGAFLFVLLVTTSPVLGPGTAVGDDGGIFSDAKDPPLNHRASHPIC